jgi:glycosyltransferase involved in cell wall biosynthesis
VQGRIDQILAGFAEGDAITNEALILRDMFREWGIESDIFADLRSVAPDSVGRCRPLPDYKGCEQDTAIHHYSISSPAVRVFLGAPAKKVLMYHNITPGSFFDGYDDGVASLLREGRREIAAILPQMDAVWAVSNFNARELTELGARSARVLPLLFSTSQFDVGSDSYAAGAFAVPMRSILFVGRIAPNKRRGISRCFGCS